MISAGIIQKSMNGSEFVYQIGDVKVVSPVPIPELEQNLQRPTVLTTVVGFPMARDIQRLRKEGI